MRILVLGAGATGGYFGGRLLQAGRDVTFLVRAGRASELAASGLVIRSSFGNATLQDPPTVSTDNIEGTYDLILLSCKAYDLDDAIAAIGPAIDADTLILPLLNGMRHLDVLDECFGASRVLGGLCVIAATLDDQRNVVHLNDLHSITFGARNDEPAERMAQLVESLGGAGFEIVASNEILLAMWEKWVLLATLAAMTCLMRASVGVIVASPGGRKLVDRLFNECVGIATAAGFAPRPKFIERTRSIMTTEGSTLTASMMRDLEAGYRIEADQIVGDLLGRKETGDSDDLSLLEVAYAHLKAHEIRQSGI